MAQVACKECGTMIMESTFQKNDGLCMLCKKGAITCSQCGKRTFGGTRGLVTGELCLTCFGAREKKKPTQIDAFIQAQGKGECSLLRALFNLDERLRIEDADSFIGLNLIDPPRNYRDCGTVLYSPRTTPTNTIAFASTGGDDVHFSLIQHEKTLDDNSPVVMTVPMGGEDVRAINIILGSNLHEFLCLGCEHGYFDLEQLLYDRPGTIARLSSREQNDEEAKETLSVYRRDLGLKPWTEIGTRLLELDDQFKRTLKFKRRWLGGR
jgi:hypothetical protein